MTQPKEYKVEASENGGYILTDWQAGSSSFGKRFIFSFIEEAFEFLMKKMGPKALEAEINIVEGKPF